MIALFCFLIFCCGFMAGWGFFKTFHEWLANEILSQDAKNLIKRDFSVYLQNLKEKNKRDK